MSVQSRHKRVREKINFPSCMSVNAYIPVLLIWCFGFLLVLALIEFKPIKLRFLLCLHFTPPYRFHQTTECVIEWYACECVLWLRFGSVRAVCIVKTIHWRTDGLASIHSHTHREREYHLKLIICKTRLLACRFNYHVTCHLWPKNKTFCSLKQTFLSLALAHSLAQSLFIR